MAMIPGGIIRDQVCPGISKAWKSEGTELRVMAMAWTRARVTDWSRTRIRNSALTRATARTRAMARARATARTRPGTRNRSRARTKVICSTGIPSNTGNIDRLKANSPMAYLVGKAGSSAGLPKKTV